MQLKLLFFLFFTGVCLAQEQDLKRNFEPIKSRGLLPEVFTQNIREVIDQDIADLKKGKDSEADLKSSFLTASNYQIQRIIRSGNALVNDEISAYLNAVTDVILKDNPKLREKIQVYTLKSPVVNAYSFDKGYIFVNIGLLSQVESEAQLAYILCHEISHYLKKHHINTFVANDRIDKTSYNGRTADKVVEKCQYSREFESEADIEGFKLFERTLYDLRQAEKGFTMLQYSHLPFELEELKKSYFETQYYKLPPYYFLKEYSSIKDNSDEDDSRMTHPNTRKRRMAVGELVANRDNTGRMQAIVGQSKFEYIRDLSRMELCRLYLKQRDYPNAFYASYILSGRFPQNRYVAEVMAKSMYGISLYLMGDLKYNDDSYLPEGIIGYQRVESFPQQLYYLINKMDAHEWAVFSLNKVYRDHKKFPESTELNAISDSLFSVLGRTNWKINGFARTSKRDTGLVALSKDSVIAVKSKTDIIAVLQNGALPSFEDTIYYKNAFVDLFETDPVFTRKFPYSNKKEQKITDFFIDNGRKKIFYGGTDGVPEININPDSVGIIDTVLLLEPFFVRINQREKQSFKYASSHQKQQELVNNLGSISQSLGIKVINMDPGKMNKSEVDKMNDYSVINDWFDERFDSETSNKIILNTNEIGTIIAKYNCRFVLKTGFANIVTESGKKRTYFLGFLYDMKSNQIVYRKYEVFKGKDRNDLLHAKTYQMLFEFTHPKRSN